MIGNSGIDQDVQAKMNAYRGNPNALAQQYQQGQQLIDLLALQKLKSEKEAAAREMQLKMGGGQKPTVGQQLESEVLDLTKQELAQNTAGSMQTKQNQEQQAAKQLVQRTAQMPTQSPSPMTQGVAGLPANNMTTQAMATGGIVAFEEGGPADGMDPAANEEMMRFIAAQQRAREGVAPAPRRSDMAGLAQQGIRNLIGTRTPDETFEQRTERATRAADYSPDERAARMRQVADLSASDARAYSPEQQGLEALIQFFVGGANRSNAGSVYAGGAAASENYKASMRDADRNRLVDRQKKESDIIDVGPAARLAGMKLGSEGERTAMTGLAQGTGDAVRLMQMSERAAAAGNPDEAKRLAAAARHINGDKTLGAMSKALTKFIEEGSTESSGYNQLIQDMTSRQDEIYKLYGIVNPQIPVASQASPEPEEKGSGILGFLGLNPTPKNRAVPFSALQQSRP